MNITRNNDLLTVAGSLNSHPTNLTVNGANATIYDDLTFALTDGITITNGLNVLTAQTVSNSLTLTNRLVEFLPLTVNLHYDLNGNLISDRLHGYDYDCANELTRITVTNILKAEFTYDGFGRRRVRKEYAWQTNQWAQTGETRYVYDGLLVLQERSGNNVPLASYTRGVDLSGTMQGAGGIGGLLARTDTNTTAYYHADGNGNITMMIDGSGTMQAKYLYDSYGNTLGMWGTLASANPYRFSSKELETSAGLYYYGLRYYQPNLQRWLNRDPIRESGGLNLYGYVGNDPVNYVDLLGLAPGDRYPTRNAAAIQALVDIYPISLEQGYEYAGRIYQNPNDGTYSYTSPTTIHSPDTSPANGGTCPADKLPRGYYHTHPNLPPPYRVEDFSGFGGDMQISENQHQPAFVATPSGAIKRYDPIATDRNPDPSYKATGMGPVTTIGTWKK